MDIVFDKSRITKYSDLEADDSLSCYLNYSAQQSHAAYEVFFDFLKEIQPARILEIGTGFGGFTHFLGLTRDELGLSTNIRTYDIHAPWGLQGYIDKNIDARQENIFGEEYNTVTQEVIDYIQQDGITVVLCDGGSKISEFNLLAKYIKVDDFIMAHDYAANDEVFFEKINKKIWNWKEITDIYVLDAMLDNNLIKYKEDVFQNAAWLCTRKINALY